MLNLDITPIIQFSVQKPENETREFHYKSNNLDMKSSGNRSKIFWLISILIVLKSLTSLSYFLLFDFLSLSSPTPVPLEANLHTPQTGLFRLWSPSFQVLAIIQFGSGLLYTILQKPFGRTDKQPLLTKSINCRITVHALISIGLSVLFISGLQLCGALRTILVASHYDFTVAGIVSSFVFFKSGPKLRGAFLFGIGWAVLLLYDDTTLKTLTTSHPPRRENEEQTLFSRNSVGLILLLAWLFLKFGFSATSKSLATDLGGPARLHALSTLASGIILILLLLLDLLSNADMIPVGSNVMSLSFITIFGFALDYYVDTICSKKMEASRNSRIGTTSSHFSALLIGLVWAGPDDIPTTASLIAFALIYLGVLSLTSAEQASGGGSFVGYSSEGLPLFSFSNQHSEIVVNRRWIQSIIRFLCFFMKIFEDSNTRKLFYVFVINFTFCCVEFVFGYIGNCLGLVSDGFHTLFDCITILIGIHSILICQCKPTSIYPFGFSRVEILFGFLNTIMTLFVSLGIIWKIIQHLVVHQFVDSTTTLLVAITGLLLNIFIQVCRSSQSDHRQYILKSSFVGKGSYKVFLVNTIGRIALVFSSIVIQNWPSVSFVDSLCALLIMCSVLQKSFPIMKETSQILLLAVPRGLERGIQQALLQILSMEGVKGYKYHRFWTHSAEVFTGSMHIQVTHDTNEQRIIRQVSGIFCSLGFSHFTIQLEKDEFLAKRNSEIISENEPLDVDRIKNDSISSINYDESEPVVIASFQKPLVL